MLTRTVNRGLVFPRFRGIAQSTCGDVNNPPLRLDCFDSMAVGVDPVFHGLLKSAIAYIGAFTAGEAGILILRAFRH